MYGGLTKEGKYDCVWIMSTKGSQPRRLNRDDKKLEDNWSQINWGKPKGVPVVKEKGGVKTRMVYKDE